MSSLHLLFFLSFLFIYIFCLFIQCLVLSLWNAANDPESKNWRKCKDLHEYFSEFQLLLFCCCLVSGIRGAAVFCENVRRSGGRTCVYCTDVAHPNFPQVIDRFRARGKRGKLFSGREDADVAGIDDVSSANAILPPCWSKILPSPKSKNKKLH